MQAKEATIVYMGMYDDNAVCSECLENIQAQCDACKEDLYDGDPIYCFQGKHYCETCGQTCDCKMD